MNQISGRIRLTVILLLPVLVTVSGCTVKLYPVPDESSRITDPLVLLDRIQARKARIKTVSTTGRMESHSARGTIRGRVTTMASSEGHVRIEAWTPTWDLLGSFLADASEFIYFERGATACIEGQPCTSNMKRLVPLGLDFEESVITLLGTPPIHDASAWTIDFDRRCGCWILSSHTEGRQKQEIWAESDGVVRRARYSTATTTTLDIQFGDIGSANNERFPFVISIKASKNKSNSVIKFRDVDLNGEIEGSDWDMVCPEGLGIQYMGCDTE